MTPELETLSQLPGVVGVCFHEEHQVIFQNLPPSYGAATAEALSRAVSRALGAYTKAERRAKEVYFQYPQCGVLVVSGQSGSGKFLSILVHDQASVAKILAPASAFLARQ